MKVFILFFIAMLVSSTFLLPVSVFAQAGDDEDIFDSPPADNPPIVGDSGLPPVVGESDGSPDLGFSISNPLKFSTIDQLITAIMGIVIQIMIPVITVMIIYTGFLFVTARGDVAKITTAKQTFLYVIIGAAIMLGAFVIKTAITGTVEELKGQSLLPIINYFYA